MRPSRLIQGGPKSNDKCPCRRKGRGGYTPTQRGSPREDGGKHQSDVSTVQGTRMTSSHQKLGDRHGPDPPSGPPEGTNSAATLILDFSFLNRVRINFCDFKPLSVWSFATTASAQSLAHEKPSWTSACRVDRRAVS